MNLNRPLTTLLLGLAVCGMAAAQGSRALPFDANGWYSWRIAAIDNAPDWCCYRWHSGQGQRTRCNLDEVKGSWGNSGEPQDSVDEMQIYARVEEGSIRRLRTLGPSCGVDTESPVTDLGEVSAAQSLAWLDQATADSRRLQSSRIAAIAVHAGEQSRDALIAQARHGESRKQREEAIFWMGQLRVKETRSELLRIIETDDSAKIREHAIFSYSQSPAPDRMDVLIAVIEDSKRDMHDRKQALFWLAQSEDPAGINYIQDLLLR